MTIKKIEQLLLHPHAKSVIVIPISHSFTFIQVIFFCYAIIRYLHRHILFIITSFSNLILQSTYIQDAILCVYYADENHTPTNTTQDHQFVGHDLSDSTDDDLNKTQENIDIGNHPLFILCFFHHQINQSNSFG